MRKLFAFVLLSFLCGNVGAQLGFDIRAPDGTLLLTFDPGTTSYFFSVDIRDTLGDMYPTAAAVDDDVNRLKAEDIALHLDDGTLAILNNNGFIGMSFTFPDTFDETNNVVVITNATYDSVNNLFEIANQLAVPAPTYYYKCDDSNANSTVIDTMGSSTGKLYRRIGSVALNTEDYSISGKLGSAFDYRNLEGVTTEYTIDRFVNGSTGFSFFGWYTFDDGQQPAGEDGLMGTQDTGNSLINITLAVAAGGSGGKLTGYATDAAGNLFRSISGVVIPNGLITDWMLIGMVFDLSGVIKLYTNGYEVTSYSQQLAVGAFNETTMVSASNMTFGTWDRWGLNDRYHRGGVDDMRFYYNYLTTDADILALWNNGAGTAAISPVLGGANPTAVLQSTNLPPIAYIPTNASLAVWVVETGPVLVNGDIMGYVSDDGGATRQLIELTKSTSPVFAGANPIYVFSGATNYPGVDSNVWWEIKFTNNVTCQFTGASIGFNNNPL